MSEEYIIALYLRISDEDKELSASCESESISGQRLVLTDFVREHMELSTSTIIEIVDDGFSGTNFDRPGITRLLEMAKIHQVDCIVVKDFSRFGRNYLEVGNYLEQIFPFLGIRFISMNDHFDSFESIGAAGAIEVGFKNIIYEAYSKDLSEKIKSVRRLKAEQGKFVSAFAPYGFRKAKVSKNQLVIDEVCAVNVRRIFDLFLSGMGKTEIARLLNKELIPSPMMVRKLRNENFHRIECNKQNHWTASTVSHILSDQRYVGDAVYGKVTPKKVGSKKDIHVPREDWIVVPDAHPRIIEREMFEAVQSGKKKHNYKRTEEEKPLAKKIICCACSHALKRICKGTQVYFQCTTHRNTDRYPCFTGNLPESTLEAAILTYLQSLTLSIQKQGIEIERIKGPASVTLFKKLKKAEEKIDKKKGDIFALYGALKAGKITQDAFVKKTDDMEAELELLDEQVNQYLQDYTKAIQEQNHLAPADADRIRKHMLFNCLTKEVIDEFVEAVYIEIDGNISIKWSFSDPFLQDMGEKL
jgi:site-specific DNA recombinase